MKRLLITSTALSMIVTSVPLPVYAQQTVRVGDRDVICLSSEDEPCPDGASCVVAKRPKNCERNANRKFGSEGNAEAVAPAEEPAVEAEAPVAEEPALAEQPTEAAPEVLAEPDAAEAPAKPKRKRAEEAPAEAIVVPEAEVAPKPKRTKEAPAEQEPELLRDAPVDELVIDEAPAEEVIAPEPETAPELTEEAPAAEPEMILEDPVDAAPEVAIEDLPVEENPVLTEEAPAVTEEAPVLTEDAPVLTDDAPLLDEAPVLTEEQPSDETPEAEPAIIAEDPADVPEAISDAAPLTDEQLLGAVDAAEGVEAPTAREVGALSDILADDDATVDAPVAAADAPAVPAEDPTDGGATDEALSDRPATDQETVGRERPREEVLEVTEGDTRSSDEDFNGEVIETERARDDNGRNRLSKLEKFGLVALGALVVGSVLRNGNQVVSNTGDRVVVQQPDGTYVVLKDDDALLRQPGSTVRTETFSDGSTRSIVVGADGSRVITIRDAAGRVLKRSRIDAAGREVLLIDDLAPVERIDVSSLPAPRQGAVISTSNGDAAMRAALLAEDARSIGRTFSLRQIREYRQVRALAPSIDVESITFPSGSAAIRATEAQKLAQLGRLMASMVEENPAEMFLIEGHTDAVGAASYNLALSDRRAESVALALTEYYGVPPENMVVQGYGEQELLVPTASDEPANRRAAVKIISPLMQRVAAN